MLIKGGSTPGLVILLDAGNLTLTPTSYGIANGSMVIGGSGSFSPAVGMCGITPTAGETAGNNQLTFVALDGGGAILGRLEVQTVPWDPDNAASLGLTNLDAPISTVIAGIVTALTDLGTVLSDLGTVLSDLGTLATAVSGVPAALLDLAAGVETGFTVRQGLRVLTAALAGKIGIAGTTVTFRSINDTKNRIICTVDGTGQRLSFTFDLT